MATYNNVDIPDVLTPYKAAKIVSSIEGRELPPQMFYTYAKKEYIPSSKNAEGKIVFNGDDLVAWMTKRHNKTATSTPSKLYKQVVNLEHSDR